MRKFLITLFLLLFVPTLCFGAAGGYGAYCLTGGTTGCVDAIDGDLLSDGDKLTAWVSGVRYDYNLNGSSSCTEGSVIANITPIKPDTNPGTKCWELQKLRGIDFQATTGAAINEFSIDGTLAGNSDTAVPTEKAVKTYSDTKSADTDFPGFLIRAKIDHADDDTITINPGMYHHQGTTEWFVYWDSAITFDVGSGGSNAASDDLGASEWHYIYLDDTAIVTQAAALLDADCFSNNTTAPTWSVANHGWYNGNDRAIGAFYSDADSDILEFFHNGNGVYYGDTITDRAQADLDAAWVDTTLTIPGFATEAQVTFRLDAAADANPRSASWRTNGQAAAVGHRIGFCDANTTSTHDNTLIVITDSSQIIEVKMSGAGDHQLQVGTEGWYYPTGM